MSDNGGLTFSLTGASFDRLAERVAELLAERTAAAPPPGPLPEYLNVAEAAEDLRAKPQRVYDLLSSGRLTRYKDGASS